MNLCKKLVIPEEVHELYKDIPSSNKKIDCIPEPAIEVESDVDC